MENRGKELIKNTSLLLIGNVGSKLISFILIPIYTSVLTTAEYGSFDILATTESLLIPILTVDIGDAVFRYAMEKQNKPSKVFYSGFLVWLVGSLFFVIASFLFVNTKVYHYLWFLLTAYFAHSLYTLLINYAKGIDELQLIAVAGILNTFVFGVLSIFFLLIVPFGLQGYMLAYVFGFLIPDFFLIISLKKKIVISHELFDSKLVSRMLKYSFPLVFASISWWIISASDRYMVTWFCGSSENGLYSMSYKIPNILVAIMTIFSQAWVVSAVKENDNDFYRKIYKIYTILISSIGCLVIGNSELIGRLLYSSDFYLAWKLSPILIMAAIYQGLTGFLCDILTSRKDAKGIALASLIGSFLNLALNFVLINKCDAYGAAIATLISYLVVWAVLIVRLKTNHFISIIDFKDIIQILLLSITILCLYKSLAAGYTAAAISVLLFIVLNISTVQMIYNKVVKGFKGRKV